MKKITAILIASLFLISIGYVYAADGDLIWAKTYDSGNHDYGYGVATDSQNNVIVTGYVYNGANTDYYTIKYEGIPPPKSKSLPMAQILKILGLYPKE